MYSASWTKSRMNCTAVVHVFKIPDTNSACRKASDRKKDNLIQDRESKNAVLRQLEADLHRKELEESECRNRLRDKDELERRIEEMKAEIATAQARLKVGFLGYQFDHPSLTSPWGITRIWTPGLRRPKSLSRSSRGSTRNWSENSTPKSLRHRRLRKTST